MSTPDTQPNTPATRPPRDLITVEEVAERLAVPHRKIYSLMEVGALPYVRIGRSRRILVADLEDFIAGLRALPAGDPGREIALTPSGREGA